MKVIVTLNSIRLINFFYSVVNQTFAKKLLALDGYEIVFICDDSGSMNTPLGKRAMFAILSSLIVWWIGDVNGPYDNPPTRCKIDLVYVFCRHSSCWLNRGWTETHSFNRRWFSQCSRSEWCWRLFSQSRTGSQRSTFIRINTCFRCSTWRSILLSVSIDFSLRICF